MSISKIRSTVSKALAALTVAAFLALPAFAQDQGGAQPANPAPAVTPTATQTPAPAVAPTTAQTPAPATGTASAEDRNAPPPPQGGLFGGNFLFIMAAMFAIIYFFMIRPEQKKQKERQKMLSALKKGDKVLTIGGLVGVVTVIKDSTYIVKSGEGAVFEITKSAISNQINDAKESREVLAADAPTPDAKENK